MAYLKFIKNSYPEKLRAFTNEITIGRTPDNDICISEELVSRRHAAIRYTNDTYVIEDLGSKNGVYINNQKISSFTAKPLNDGDSIRISSVFMLFGSELNEKSQKGKPSKIKNAELPEQNKGIEKMDGITVIIKHNISSPPNAETIIDTTTSTEIEKETPLKNLKNAVKRFQAMVTISSELAMVTDPDCLLEKIINNIFSVFPQADRSFIMLPQQKDSFSPVFGRRRSSSKKNNSDFKVSKTILNHVILEKKSVLSSYAPSDSRFTGGSSIVDFSIQSLMYVPFIFKEEILGIITVDSRSNKEAFNKNDLAMLTGLAAQAAVALKNAELYKEIKKETQTRTHLSRYLSSEVVEGIVQGTIPFQLGGETKYGTVLFCDIVGFTHLSESMTAVEVIEKLNRYFHLFTEVIAHNKGTLHKFEGDMVMAFWNVLIPDTRADINAIQSALEMQIAVWRLGIELEAEGDRPFYIGVGCNTGEFAGGNIGGKGKMEYTVIGDNINLSKRIESLAGRWQILVSESTYHAIKDKCIAIGLPKTMVKGRSHSIHVFSIRGIELYQDVMLLAIPMVVKDAKGLYSQRGMVTGSCMENGKLTLCVLIKDQVKDNETIVLRLFLSELQKNFEFSGKVHSAKTRSHQGKNIFTHCRLIDVECNETTQTFLEPGHYSLSNKSWQEMRRI